MTQENVLILLLLLLPPTLLGMISGGVEVRRAVKLAKLCLTCGETETDQRNFAEPSQNLNKSQILQKSEQTCDENSLGGRREGGVKLCKM